MANRVMKDSGINWIGKIPLNWNIKKIKYSLKTRSENNTPIKSKNILSLTAKQGVIPLENKIGGGNKPKEDYSDYKLAYPGDIVLNSMNILSGSVGLSKYFGCVSPVYYTFYLDDTFNDIRYYNYIFQTKMFQKSLVGLGNGILIKKSENGNFNTIRMRIPIDKFNNLFIPTTNNLEQKSIADYLDNKCSEIDKLKEDITKQIDILKKYKQSIITETVTKGLNPNVPMKDSGIDWIGKIPTNWEIKKGKYCLSCIQKPTKDNDEIITCFRDGKVTLRNNRREDGFTISTKEIGYQGIDKGDLIVHSMDGFAGAIGISDSRGKASPVLVVLESLNNKRYLMYYLRSLAYNGIFLALSTGIRVRTCDTNWGKLKNIQYLLPPLLEQNIIANYLDNKCAEIDKIISSKEEQLNTLDEYKKSLIYEYVTGKKEVPQKD